MKRIMTHPLEIELLADCIVSVGDSWSYIKLRLSIGCQNFFFEKQFNSNLIELNQKPI